MRAYLGEIAELFGGLCCALLNHWSGCALLSYRTRYWNPIAFLYHWGTDVAWDQGRTSPRCGCIRPLVTVAHEPGSATVVYRVNGIFAETR